MAIASSVSKGITTSTGRRPLRAMRIWLYVDKQCRFHIPTGIKPSGRPYRRLCNLAPSSMPTPMGLHPIELDAIKQRSNMITFSSGEPTGRQRRLYVRSRPPRRSSSSTSNRVGASQMAVLASTQRPGAYLGLQVTVGKDQVGRFTKFQ